MVLDNLLEPCDFVLFGTKGDLARRKLLQHSLVRELRLFALRLRLDAVVHGISWNITGNAYNLKPTDVSDDIYSRTAL